MFELLKAAAWRYIKIVIAETIYDIKKEIHKREQGDKETEGPKFEGGLRADVDFEHPYLLGRENEVLARGFGFTSENRRTIDRIRN